MIPELIKRIKKHEGFSGVAYPDPLSGGKPYTFGYGFTYVTKEESAVILANRVIDLKIEIEKRYPFVEDNDIKGVLIEMAYQMGLNGLATFKKFIRALKRQDYRRASKEMIDSRWANQTPGRATGLALIIRGKE